MTKADLITDIADKPKFPWARAAASMMEGCRRAAARCCFGYRRFVPLLRVTLATRPRLLAAGNFSSATRRIHHVGSGRDPRGLAARGFSPDEQQTRLGASAAHRMT
jgi:hypothetical protein